MPIQKAIRIKQAASKLGVGTATISEFLSKNGFKVDSNANVKITPDQYKLLKEKFADDMAVKQESEEFIFNKQITEKSEYTDAILETEKVYEDKKKDNSPAIQADLKITPFLSSEPIPAVDSENDSKKSKKKEIEKIIIKKPKLAGLKTKGKIELYSLTKKETFSKKDKNEKLTFTKSHSDIKKEILSPPLQEKEKEKEFLQEDSSVTDIARLQKQKDTNESKKLIKAKAERLSGLKIVERIDLKKVNPVIAASSDTSSESKEDLHRKKKRKRIKQRIDNKVGRSSEDETNKFRQKKDQSKKSDVLEREVGKTMKKTFIKMNLSTSERLTQKRQYRKEKRSTSLNIKRKEILETRDEQKKLKVTEFISTMELATLMNISVNDIITEIIKLGILVSINQRLDSDTIRLITESFGYTVDFISNKNEVAILESEDEKEELDTRAPIVTIMGHVNHGKTSLLDWIRDSQIAQKEAGGITQHIGAYSIFTKSKNRIVFLDTPGHEAFTAMRARGTKLTDIAIIVIAADDSIMPQTIEALNHASVADVPIVIAINKIDKPHANPYKVKKELSELNYLVEEWKGKYQCYEISAKTGQGVEELLEGILLEAEVLELKANSKKRAIGTIVEASLDRGRGYTATAMVQNGTLFIGNIILAGNHYGRIKALTDCRGEKLEKAGPSTPVQILGLGGAPQAGDKFNIVTSEIEARTITSRREQIAREQSNRATKRVTLKDLGERTLIDFKQINIILRGDVDGSIEALSGSLLELSSQEVEINIIHKAVGSISESDISLAVASQGIIIGFRVRPTLLAKRLAEKERVEIRFYSVIFDAVSDVKQAIEGMIPTKVEEKIIGNVEVREVFKIPRSGNIAGGYVTEGYIKKNSKIKIIREGTVVYGADKIGEIKTLKRFKDDVNEVRQNLECGLAIKNFNNIKVGDIIEVFEFQDLK